VWVRKRLEEKQRKTTKLEQKREAASMESLRNDDVSFEICTRIFPVARQI
jgi:hypothetical protein